MSEDKTTTGRTPSPPRPSGDRYCPRCGVMVVSGNHVCKSGRSPSRSTRVVNVFRRLRSRIADAYWERKGRVEPISPERETRLLARLDQALATNRDKRRMAVCDDPDCEPYGEHYRRLHGGTE